MSEFDRSNDLVLSRDGTLCRWVDHGDGEDIEVEPLGLIGEVEHLIGREERADYERLWSEWRDARNYYRLGA